MPEEITSGGKSPVLVIFLYIIGSAYLLWRLIHLIRLAAGAEKNEKTEKTGKGLITVLLSVVSVIFILLSSLPFFGAFLPLGDAQRFFRAAGNIWFGVVYGFAGITVFIHISEIITAIIKRVKKSGERSFGRKTACVLLSVTLLFSALFMLVGTVTARTAVKTEYDITLTGKKCNTDKLKIALIADLHISVNSSAEHMRDTVNIINAEEPDLVLVAGDIMTSCYTDIPSPEVYSDILSGIKSKYGVYAVYGNHDVNEPLFLGFSAARNTGVSRPAELDKFMSDCGITVLEDEQTEIGDTGITLFGRLDGENSGTDGKRKTPAELMRGSGGEKYAFVLEHEPWDFAGLSESGADFILSGHTHNGQIWPGNIITGFFNDNSYGLKNINGTQTLVTSGVGFFGPPVRLFTKSETAILNISFE